MKGYKLSLALLICLSITGCKGKNVQSVTVTPTATIAVSNSPVPQYKSQLAVEPTTAPVSTADSALDSEALLLTPEKLQAIETYLSQNTRMCFRQTMDNCKSDDSVYTRVIYNVEADTKAKKAKFTLTSSSDDGMQAGQGNVSFYCDYVTNTNYIQNNNTWLPATTNLPVMSWDFARYTSVLDIFKFLLGSVELTPNVTGQLVGTKECYTIKTKPNKDLLLGLAYTKLNEQTITYTIEPMEDGGYKPVSLGVMITYENEGTQYYIHSNITFDLIDSASINLD